MYMMDVATNVLQYNWSFQNKQLLDAATNGDLRTLRKCLRSGAEVNYRGIKGETALHCAVQRRHYGIVKELLNFPGANLNILDFCSDSPLIQACRAKSFVLAKALLGVGADKEVRGWCGQRAIDIARENDSADIVELFQNDDNHGDSSDHTFTIDEEYEELNHLMSQHDQNEESFPPSNVEEILQSMKMKMTDYYGRFCQMMEKYLQLLSESPTWKQLQQIYSLWNGKHHRPQLTGIDMTHNDGAKAIMEGGNKAEIMEGLAITQKPEETGDSEQDRGASNTWEISPPEISQTHPLATMTDKTFEEIQQDIYSAKEINMYVYEVYLNSTEELCISIIEGNKTLVEDYVHREHGENIRMNFFEQPDYNNAQFLAGGDFVQKPAMGPGSCFTTVDDRFLTNDLHNIDNNLNFSDVVTGPGIGQTLSWGTLGCFATVSEGDQDLLYSLSAKHVIDRVDSEKGNDANVITGIAVQKDIHCFPDNEHEESFPLSFQRTLHVSKNYFGIQRKSQHGDKEVDVVMLGPIFKPLLEQHKPFSPLYELKIPTGFDMVRVKKIGAATGLTKGQVISIWKTQGLFVVVNRVSMQPVEDMEIVPKAFAKPGDSGAIVLLDNTPDLQGIGIVHRILPSYNDGHENEVVYKDAVLCVRLDYCTEALSKFQEFKDFNNRVKLYLRHLHPNLQLHQQQISL